MSNEPWRSERTTSEADSALEQTGMLSDGSEDTVYDYEDVRDYDLGEGD